MSECLMKDRCLYVGKLTPAVRPSAADAAAECSALKSLFPRYPWLVRAHPAVLKVKTRRI